MLVLLWLSPSLISGWYGTGGETSSPDIVCKELFGTFSVNSGGVEDNLTACISIQGHLLHFSSIYFSLGRSLP